LKKDIFHGKIKQEYFSYILGYMIFFVLLFIAIGALCIYASIWGMKTNNSGERLLIASFGGIAFVLAGVYVFLEFLVIHNFPKYQKIRRILFNSDIYFTDSTSNEYFGGSRTLRGRRNKAAFEVVTTFAEAEKGMGKKKPIRYTVYSALTLVMAVLGLANLIAMPLLYENGTVFSNVSQNFFLFCYLSVGFVCIALAILFLICALKVAIIAPLENHKWTYELYSSLVDIAVRRNNKKLKFCYNKDQLEQIESLVKSVSENAELKLETKENKLVSFKVVDTLNQRVIFTGLFI
jgi:hypothetical protein